MEWVILLPNTCVVMECFFFFSFSYKAVSYHASGHNLAYKSGGFKASTAFGPNSKNKKIYDGGARTEDEVQSHPSKYDYV